MTEKLPPTKREWELVRLIAEEMTREEIAAHMGITTDTVDRHRYNVYRKLGVGNPLSLVLEAMRRGIVKPPKRKHAA